MLYIDVNMGDKLERIVVREGDNASELAKNFANEHSIFSNNLLGLNEDARGKLEDLIAEKLKSFLTNIEEENDNETEVKKHNE